MSSPSSASDWTAHYTFPRASTMATRSLLSDADPSNAQAQSPRDQANAALEANSASQTSAAAAAPASSSTSAYSPLSADDDAGTRPSMPRRSTTNYEQAQAAADADAEQQAQAGEGDGVRPYLDRHQSWNQSDMRRMMTEKILDAESGAGYSST
ncbi:hypothetical protein LTR28_012842 [Elasticomyces elasticus]|nr:hypothetical protein LTR28_012842 [Elasticomyces elasticus]